MKPLFPVWLFTLSVLFLLNAAAVQAQIEPHESRALRVAQERNTHDGRLPDPLANRGKAFVTAQRNKLAAFESATMSSAANNVRLVGQIGGTIDAVYVSGNQAYIGEGNSLTILNIAQPDQPKLLNRTQPLPDSVYGVFVKANYAYVVAGAAGLYIFDISNPTRPLAMGSYDTPGTAHGIFVSNNYAYVADEDKGLRVINVADPTAPSEVGAYDTPGSAWGVYVLGTYAYVADYQMGLRVINVTDPTLPTEVGVYDKPGDAHGVVVSGDYAYVADGDYGLRIVDVKNPTAPVIVGAYPTATLAQSVYISGTYAYLANGLSGLRVVDIANPAAPSEVSFLPIAGYPRSVAMTGAYVFAASEAGGLHVVNVANKTTPVEVNFYSSGGSTNNVFIVDSYAYLADSSGLYIVNITKPAAPVKVGFVSLPKGGNDVYVSQNYAYVAGGEYGLRVIDVSKPTAPVEVGFYDTPGYAFGIYVEGNDAFVADWDAGLRIINIASPTAPTETSFYDTPGRAFDVYLSGSLAYVADEDNGLQIINVTNRALPNAVGAYDTPGQAAGVFVSGNYAYVADEGAGLRVINVTNPVAPTEAGFYDTPGYAFGVTLAGRYAYVAAGNELRVIDVQNSASPNEIAFYTNIGFAAKARVSGNIIYVAAGSNGLALMRYPACYQLTRKFTGFGAIPSATPISSAGCQSGEYLSGEVITLNATPAADWHVAGWQGTSNDTSTSTVNQFTMPAADYEVTVRYAPTCYALTLTHTGTGNNPTVTPPNSEGCVFGQYVAGQLVTLQAAPGAGSIVGNWSGTANDNSSAIQNTLTMPAAAYNAGVNYVLGCYGLTLTHTGSGADPIAAPTQAVGCTNGKYHSNDRIDLSASPASGWVVNAWSGTVNNAITATANALIMPANDYSAEVHYGEAPVTAQGDLYELDNTCTRSRSVTTDGSELQQHSFHVAGDVDWVRFDAAANARYRIEVSVPATSAADVVMEVYSDCASAPLDTWNASFSPGARLDISRTVSGPTYIRLSNLDPVVAGNQVRYELSARKLGDAPTNRALLIVAGRLKLNDPVQPNIDKVASNVYKLFQRNGYEDKNIQLFASNANLPGYAGAASKANLLAAIRQAASKVANGVFTLYLVDHGSPELFYLDGVGQETLTPAELNDWLNGLESAAPGVKVNVIIEACESGSFIAKPGSISKPGRVVLTSSNAENDAKASKEGAYFSDHLLTWLQQGFNLSASFFEARSAAKSIYSLQDAWLDGNGNGLANEFDDAALAAQRSFAYAGSLPGNEWPPHIFQAAGVGEITDQKARLRVDVRDDGGVRQVWAIVYEPDYSPPLPSQVLQREVLPTFLFTRVDNENHWEAEVTGLTKPGTYRLIIQADDEQGLVASPVSIEVNATTKSESKVFLPYLSR